MRIISAACVAAIAAIALASCESSGEQYDGVSRFAGLPNAYHGPGSPPREEEPAPPLPDIPGTSGDLSATPHTG